MSGARTFTAATAMLALTACADMSEGLAAQLAAIGSNPNATNEGIRTLALIGGEVRVRGPQGYCVDQGASDARTGFAVMAGCALMSDEVGVMPTLDGLITVQFGAPDTASVSGNEEAFAAFLRSEAGRGLLAGNGELASIGEVNTITDQAGVLARFSDDSGPPISGTTGPQWRGFLDINGRLTTISVLSFERAPLSRGQGERLLVVAMAELAEVNAPATPVE